MTSKGVKKVIIISQFMLPECSELKKKNDPSYLFSYFLSNKSKFLLYCIIYNLVGKHTLKAC